MSALACDRCGRSLLAFEDVRYTLEMKLTAAYDPLEISPASLAGRDLDGEIRELIAACEKRTAEELESDVHKEWRFDICLRCQRELLRDPLPRRAPDAPPERTE